jgi:hypothetical protein
MTEIMHTVDDVISFIRDHWKLIVGIFGGPIGAIVALTVKYWHEISDTIETVTRLIVKFLKASWDEITGVFKAAFDLIYGSVRTTFDLISGIIRINLDVIRGIIEIWIDVIQGHWSAAWHQLLATAKQLLSNIVSLIKSVTSSFGNMLYSAGRDLVEGLINGVTSMFGSVASTAENLVSSLGSKVLHVLGIGSPSRVAMYWGQMTGEGLVQGMLGKTAAVTAAAHQLALSAATGLGGAAGARVTSPVLSTAGATGAAAAAAAAPAPTGNVNIYVDGQKLFTILQSQLYRYNIRNSGAGVTGVWKPA